MISTQLDISHGRCKFRTELLPKIASNEDIFTHLKQHYNIFVRNALDKLTHKKLELSDAQPKLRLLMVWC